LTTVTVLEHVAKLKWNQLLLVLWKTLLACCGGIRELARAKKLARELANLPSVPDEG
jgi:hypothetical protein